MGILTGVDVLGIQRFVFASRRLRDVVGASWLVKQATERGHDTALAKAGAERQAIVAAGGNVLLEFPGDGEKKEFARKYTRWILENVPGLDVAVAHERYDGNFVSAVQNLMGAMDRAKAGHRPSVPLLGLGVTASCRQTGMPATAVDRFEGPISNLIQPSRAPSTLDAANRRWEELLPSRLPEVLAADSDQKLAFPMEIEDLGGTRGDTSLIGVVHIDGNGIGALINDWLKNADGSDAEIKKSFAGLSASLETLGDAAMRAIVNRVVDGIRRVRDARGEIRYQFGASPPTGVGKGGDLRFWLRSDKQHIYLPLRPVLLGGDDLTFLCDGRIALDLAVAGLRAFRKQATTKGDLSRTGACAGVAIVQAHWPFRRAVELANELCASAKKKVQGTDGALAIDWHIAATKPGETVEGLRSRQYEGQKLTRRPYIVGADETAPLNADRWEWLEQTLLDTLRSRPWSRNKVKALSALARQGETTLERTLKEWTTLDTEIRLPEPILKSGFEGARTPLLDAAELLDIHLRCTG
jgi:CRISPR-associated protein.